MNASGKLHLTQLTFRGNTSYAFAMRHVSIHFFFLFVTINLDGVYNIPAILKITCPSGIIFFHSIYGGYCAANNATRLFAQQPSADASYGNFESRSVHYSRLQYAEVIGK